MTPPNKDSTLTTFHVIAPKRRIWRAGVVSVLLAIGVIGGVAASDILVTHRADTSAIFAERYDINESFVTGPTVIAPATAALDAMGVDGNPVELTAPPSSANPAIARDVWTYSFLLKEASAGAVTSGEFTVELFVDGTSVGIVHVAQGTSNASAVEGARITFPIGTALSTSSVYYVVVKPYSHAGPVLDLTIKSNPDGSNTWVGVGGSIDGQKNPTLSVPVGTTLRLTANNGGDDMSHNIGIKDASGANAVTFSPIFGMGGSGVVAWTPTAAGTYTYLCSIHASATSGTMRGTITVS